MIKVGIEKSLIIFRNLCTHAHTLPLCFLWVFAGPVADHNSSFLEFPLLYMHLSCDKYGFFT